MPFKQSLLLEHTDFVPVTQVFARNWVAVEGAHHPWCPPQSACVEQPHVRDRPEGERPDLADADNIDQAYRRFHAKNVGIDDVLREQGNAVMLWHAHPADADLARITGCLK